MDKNYNGKDNRIMDYQRTTTQDIMDIHITNYYLYKKKMLAKN